MRRVEGTTAGPLRDLGEPAVAPTVSQTARARPGSPARRHPDDRRHVVRGLVAAATPSSCACSTTTAAQRVVPLTERHARRLARLRRRCAARPALRLPGARPVGPGARAPLRPRRSCSSTRTPGRSTASCSSTRRCSARTRPATTRLPTRATRRRSCRSRSSSTRRFDWQRRPPPAGAVGRHGRLRAARAGFTAAHPGVPDDLRGTYAGLAHPAAVEHLVGLGVTTVELLPVHHFASEPDAAARAAGRTTGATTRSASSRRTPATRRPARAAQQVTEFRDDGAGAARRRARGRARRRLQPHRGGRRRRADAVLARAGQRGVLPAAGRRRRYVDVTGCGNTLDLRHPRTLAMVMDSLRYWVQEMHVDGFRFDLAPALARGTDRSSGTAPSSACSRRTRCCRG